MFRRWTILSWWARPDSEVTILCVIAFFTIFFTRNTWVRLDLDFSLYFSTINKIPLISKISKFSNIALIQIFRRKIFSKSFSFSQIFYLLLLLHLLSWTFLFVTITHYRRYIIPNSLIFSKTTIVHPDNLPPKVSIFAQNWNATAVWLKKACTRISMAREAEFGGKSKRRMCSWGKIDKIFVERWIFVNRDFFSIPVEF